MLLDIFLDRYAHLRLPHRRRNLYQFDTGVDVDDLIKVRILCMILKLSPSMASGLSMIDSND